MNIFVYKARDRQGLPIAGTAEVEDEQTLVQNLGHLGYSVVSIEKKSQANLFLQGFLQKRKVKKEQLIFFTRQLQVMLKSGIPLVTALSGLSEQSKDRSLKQIIKVISQDVEKGMSFSASLAKYPNVFSETFVGMIEAGESAGILEEILDRLTQLNSQQLEMRMRLKSAFSYPIILVVVAIIILSFLLVNILPKFILIFETYDAKLPFATQILLKASFLIRHFWHITIVAVLGFVFCFRKYIRTEKGRYYFHLYLLKMPLFGTLYSKIIISRFTRVFGAMSKAGVPILKALSVSEKTISNVAIKKVIRNISLSISKGESLAEPFKISGLFPTMVIQMISAGEKTGQLDRMLLEIADFYEREIDYSIKNVANILEPALLLMMGLIVAFIALSVLLPIFNLVKIFR